MTEPPTPRRKLSYGQNVSAMRSAFMRAASPPLPPSKSRSRSVTSPRTPWISPPSSTSSSPPPSIPPTMQAIRLQKKYPEVSQEEMFDLINRFKYVCSLGLGCLYAYAHSPFVLAPSSVVNEALSIQMFQDVSTRRLPSLRCSRVGNRTTESAKPSKTSASMPVERSSWRTGLRYVPHPNC